MQSKIRVPLSIDTEFRLPIGPFVVPLRGLILLICFLPLTFTFFVLPGLSSTMRLLFIGISIGIPVVLATPEKEGIWIGFWFFYRFIAKHIMPAVVQGSSVYRAQVNLYKNQDIHVKKLQGVLTGKKSKNLKIDFYTTKPTVLDIQKGMFSLSSGGYRGILEIAGPTTFIGNNQYMNWCHDALELFNQIDVDVQFYAVVDHFDPDEAYNNAISHMKDAGMSNLVRTELEIAKVMAGNSLGVKHYIILLPKFSKENGIPYGSKLRSSSTVPYVNEADLLKTLQQTERLAKTMGLNVRVPEVEEIRKILKNTTLGAEKVMVNNEFLNINDQHHVIMTITKMPPVVHSGTIVDALRLAKTQVNASLHILPIEPLVAKKELQRQIQVLQFQTSKNNSATEPEVELALYDAQEVLAQISGRTLSPYRIALTFDVHSQLRQTAVESAERLESLLRSSGFGVEYVTTPGLVPALAATPGGFPLLRSIIMTSDSVVERVIPALGTPFSDNSEELVGRNLITGAPVYLDVWNSEKHNNFNAVIMGATGAGKSVTVKTMIIRDALRGSSVIIIDPDSEYRKVVEVLGGKYYELGSDAINPLSLVLRQEPAEAAGNVLVVLSVMAGDEKGIKDGRPIRRLPDEDQGWLHTELTEFFTEWKKNHSQKEPILEDLVKYLKEVSEEKMITANEKERCRIVRMRLSRYTQGSKSNIFNKESSFSIGEEAIGIGLRTLSTQYGADLTAALAMVLNETYSILTKYKRKLVVVDEAHRVTSDPDAGAVLGQLVRQARKYGFGVWMCSQRIEDFLDTDLGKTLADNAATKFLLGVQEAGLERVRETFNLSEEEAQSISPIKKGTGVLISGSERAIVHVEPGPVIMRLADTSTNFIPGQI